MKMKRMGRSLKSLLPHLALTKVCDMQSQFTDHMRKIDFLLGGNFAKLSTWCLLVLGPSPALSMILNRDTVSVKTDPPFFVNTHFTCKCFVMIILSRVFSA